MYDKITALYCRYSRDDGQETETQVLRIKRHCRKNMRKITVIPICVTMLTTDIQEQTLMR